MASPEATPVNYLLKDLKRLLPLFGTHGAWRAGPELTERGRAAWRHDVDPRAPPTNQGANPGSVAGTMLAGMAMDAGSHAVATLLAPGQRCCTAELNISYIRPAIGKSIYTESKVVGRSDHLAFAEFTSSTDEGRVVTRGRTVHAIFGSANGSEPDLANLHRDCLDEDRGSHPSFAMELKSSGRGQPKFGYVVPAEGLHAATLGAIVDMVAVAAAVSELRVGEKTNGTAQLNMSLLELDIAAGESLIVEAKVVRKGKTMAFVDCRIQEEASGKQVALGQIVYAVGQAKL